MKVRNLIGAVLIGAFSLTGCDPQIEKVEDLTGDGIEDVLLKRPFDRPLLFIGQKDGTYITAYEEQTLSGTTGNFVTNKRQFYVLDGKYYRPAQKRGKVYVFDSAQKDQK